MLALIQFIVLLLLLSLGLYTVFKSKKYFILSGIDSDPMSFKPKILFSSIVREHLLNIKNCMRKVITIILVSNNLGILHL